LRTAKTAQRQRGNRGTAMDVIEFGKVLDRRMQALHVISAG
jgi:hypothetical protein